MQGKFNELIEKVSGKGKVVILIDEYDKPLIDNLDDPDRLTEHRAALKSFYSVLKGQDGNIRLLLLTGVSRFSRVSIFSDLNNLRDITMSTQFGTIAGITQEELERDFAPEIAEMQRKQPDILTDIKAWYNGYSWDLINRLYNPFSLLNFMAEPVFRNYWYATGTPTFLFEQLSKRKIGDIEGVRISESALANFDTANPEPGPLLFQTGYLTLREAVGGSRVFVLGYPNREVKESLLAHADAATCW